MKLLERFRTAPLSILWGFGFGSGYGALSGIATAIFSTPKIVFVCIWLLILLMTLFPVKRPDRLETTPEEEMRGWVGGTFDGLVFGLCFLITSAVVYMLAVTVVVVAGP
ncbi:MAG: hypothetical protein AAB864_00340 [Patescibacteria group bacterium]